MHYRIFASGRVALILAASVSVLCHANHALAAANPVGPAVINAGPVAITPMVKMEAEYRDNIYLQQHDPTESWVSLARPTVDALVQDRNNLYQLGYKGEAAWYDVNRTNDRNDYFDNTFTGDAHMEFSERWIAEGYMRWAALHEDRGTGLSEGQIATFLPKPIEYDQGDVGGSLQFGSDRTVGRLLLKAGYMDREYQNFKEFTRARDRDETTLGSTFFYPLAPKTDVLAEYVYKDIHYPTPFAALPQLDSNENFLNAGVQWEITPNLISTAKAGYVDKAFDSPERKDWDGLGWSVELLMQPREQDRVLVRSTLAPEETTEEGNFIKREKVETVWTHDWSDRVRTQLGGLFGRDTYEQSLNDRKDDIYNVSVRVDYEFRRWAKFYTGYTYDHKDSNVQTFRYTDNGYKLGVELSL